MNFAVYAIRANNGRIYIGQTENIAHRLDAHNRGVVQSTKADRPWSWIKSENFETREQSRYFEWQLKRSRGKRLKWLGEK